MHGCGSTYSHKHKWVVCQTYLTGASNTFGSPLNYALINTHYHGIALWSCICDTPICMSFIYTAPYFPFSIQLSSQWPWWQNVTMLFASGCANCHYFSAFFSLINHWTMPDAIWIYAVAFCWDSKNKYIYSVEWPVSNWICYKSLIDWGIVSLTQASCFAL